MFTLTSPTSLPGVTITNNNSIKKNNMKNHKELIKQLKKDYDIEDWKQCSGYPDCQKYCEGIHNQEEFGEVVEGVYGYNPSDLTGFEWNQLIKDAWQELNNYEVKE